MSVIHRSMPPRWYGLLTNARPVVADAGDADPS
jgi:hypothetical protein